MPPCSLPSNSRVGRREEEEREDPSTLVAALADLPHFKGGMSIEDQMETTELNTHSYPRLQRVPLIIHALSQGLFLATINAWITADSDIDHCCEVLSLTGHRLAREFFHRYQTTKSQQFQQVGRGCDQEASGTSPDTDVPDVSPLAKPTTSSLDSVTLDHKNR
ncbi:hypothetical protein TSMEX_006181 [Taenia solium]